MQIKTASFGLILSYPIFVVLYPYWMDIVSGQYEGIFVLEPGLAELSWIPLAPTLIFVAVCIGIGCLFADGLGVLTRFAVAGVCSGARQLLELWRRPSFTPGIPQQDELCDLVPSPANGEPVVVDTSHVDSRGEFVNHRIQDALSRAVVSEATGMYLTIRPDVAVLEHVAYGARREVDRMPPEIAREIVGSLFCLDARCDRSIDDVKAPTEFSKVYMLGDRRVHVHGLLVSVYPEGSLHATLDLKYAALAGIPRVEDLGYNDRQQDNLHQSLKKPSGLTLIAGPSGCGASTTLASMVRELPLNEATYTIENPIAYDIPGVSQVDATDLAASSGFGELWRTILNGAPRNIMLSEIDCAESASMVVRSAQSGVRVFSYIRADSVLGAVNRLIDFGVSHDDLVSPELPVLVVYQRLVPILCPHCSVPAMGNISAIDSRRPGLSMRVLTAFANDLASVRYRGLGCPFCKGNGAVRRTVVAETLRLDNEAKSWVLTGRVGNIEDFLRTAEYESLRTHVFQKIKAGQVCPADAEVFAIGTLVDEYLVPLRARAS